MDATQRPEQWKPIPQYEGMYEVSDHGQVRSIDRTVVDKNGKRIALPGKLLKPGTNELGYLRVALSKEGVVRSCKVHQLVALAFIGPRPQGTETCHTNDIRTDNRPINLRYDSHSENARDHVRAGNHYETKRTHCPQGHQLELPNLRANRWKQQGHRCCLACHRASAFVAKRPHLKSRFAEIANQRYLKIMGRKENL